LKWFIPSGDVEKDRDQLEHIADFLSRVTISSLHAPIVRKYLNPRVEIATDRQLEDIQYHPDRLALADLDDVKHLASCAACRNSMLPHPWRDTYHDHYYHPLDDLLNSLKSIADRIAGEGYRAYNWDCIKHHFSNIHFEEWVKDGVDPIAKAKELLAESRVSYSTVDNNGCFTHDWEAGTTVKAIVDFFLSTAMLGLECQCEKCRKSRVCWEVSRESARLRANIPQLKCSNCGKSIHAQGEALKQYNIARQTGLETGMLCCSCFGQLMPGRKP
jgi:hypothetical protein